MKYEPLPLVSRFIEEFEKLSFEDRHRAIGEMAGFCVGYRDGVSPDELCPIEFIEDRALDESLPTEETVQSLSSAATLAETMTELDVKPHRGEEGEDAPPPKGWS